MKKLTISFLIISLFNYLACTTFNVAGKESIKEEMKNDTLSGEIKIITMNHNKYHFGESAYHIENDTLYGRGLKINSYGSVPFKGKIALDNISHFKVKEVDALATTGMILGAAAGMAILIYYGGQVLSFKPPKIFK